MNTTEAIVNAAANLCPTKILHPATISYILSIIGPHADITEDTLYGVIGLACAQVETFPVDKTILPWDVKIGIGNDTDLSRMFGIVEGDVLLPVKIVFNNQSYTHMLSLEFTCGLLLFSLQSHRNFHISLFEVPFTTNYFTETTMPGTRTLITQFRDTRFHYYNAYGDEPVRSYTVQIGDMRITFNTPDFMQGFATGAMWSEVDHHTYWNNLVQHTEDFEYGDHIETAITF